MIRFDMPSIPAEFLFFRLAMARRSCLYVMIIPGRNRPVGSCRLPRHSDNFRQSDSERIRKSESNSFRVFPITSDIGSDKVFSDRVPAKTDYRNLQDPTGSDNRCLPGPYRKTPYRIRYRKLSETHGSCWIPIFGSFRSPTVGNYRNIWGPHRIRQGDFDLG